MRRVTAKTAVARKKVPKLTKKQARAAVVAATKRLASAPAGAAWKKGGREYERVLGTFGSGRTR